MKFELSNPSILKTIIDTLSIIVDESAITFTNDKVLINALSKDHISFMLVELDKYLFDSYECTDVEIVNVDINQLAKIMKRCKNTDLMECTIDESNLTCTFKGDSTRKFNTRLIDNDYESPRPPIIDYPTKVTVSSEVFDESLKDLAIFSDVIHILIDEDYIRFRGDGQSGEAEIKYIHGEQIKEYYKSQFNIPKLQEMMKAKGFSEEITLKLGNDLPIMLTLKTPTNDAKIEFLLAPRISQDD